MILYRKNIDIFMKFLCLFLIFIGTASSNEDFSAEIKKLKTQHDLQKIDDKGAMEKIRALQVKAGSEGEKFEIAYFEARVLYKSKVANYSNKYPSFVRKIEAEFPLKKLDSRMISMKIWECDQKYLKKEIAEKWNYMIWVSSVGVKKMNTGGLETNKVDVRIVSLYIEYFLKILMKKRRASLNEGGILANYALLKNVHQFFIEVEASKMLLKISLHSITRIESDFPELKDKADALKMISSEKMELPKASPKVSAKVVKESD